MVPPGVRDYESTTSAAGSCKSCAAHQPSSSVRPPVALSWNRLDVQSKSGSWGAADGSVTHNQQSHHHPPRAPLGQCQLQPIRLSGPLPREPLAGRQRYPFGVNDLEAAREHFNRPGGRKPSWGIAHVLPASPAVDGAPNDGDHPKPSVTPGGSLKRPGYVLLSWLAPLLPLRTHRAVLRC